MPGSPAQGSVIGRRSLQSIGLCRPAGLNCRSPPRTRETDSTLGGYTQVLRAEAETPQKPEPDLPSGFGGSPWGWGGCGSLAS